MKVLRETESLEPVHEIVPQEKKMKIHLVGLKVSGGDLGQRIILFEFSDDALHSGPAIVEAPSILWPKGEVGDEQMVGIAFDRKQRQLSSGLVLWQRFADGDEPMRGFPVEGLIAKLGHCQPGSNLSEAPMGNGALKGRSDLGHDDIACPFFFEIFDSYMVVETHIASHSDPLSRGRKLGKTGSQELHRSSPRMNISRTKFSMPEVFGMSLETHQRMI